MPKIVTPTQYAHKAQRRLYDLIAAKRDQEAEGWGRVVDALFAGNGEEATRRCREEGFGEGIALEIQKIFPRGVD